MTERKKAAPKKAAPKIVIVRTYTAGVHVGTLVSRSGREVVLRDAHRVWRWHGAHTLSELSQVGSDLTVGTRISAPVPEITLTEAIEIIPCSVEGGANLTSPRWL